MFLPKGACAYYVVKNCLHYSQRKEKSFIFSCGSKKAGQDVAVICDLNNKCFTNQSS